VPVFTSTDKRSRDQMSETFRNNAYSVVVFIYTGGRSGTSQLRRVWRLRRRLQTRLNKLNIYSLTVYNDVLGYEGIFNNHFGCELSCTARYIGERIVKIVQCLMQLQKKLISILFKLQGRYVCT